MTRPQIALSLLLPLVLLAGCKAGLQPDAGMNAFGQALSAGSVFTSRAGVVAADLANVRLNMRVNDRVAPGFKVLALPDHWTEAVVKLFSPTANTAFNENQHTKTLAAASFNQQASLVPVTLATLNANPGCLTGDGQGKLYVTVAGRIDVIDTANGNAVTNLVTGLSQPSGIARHASGKLYVAQSGNGQLTEIDIATHVQTTLTTGLSGPTGVALDQSGKVYVTEKSAGRVVMVDTTQNNAVSTLASGLSSPDSVAVGNGMVYVTENGNGRVSAIDPANSNAVTAIATGLSGPHGIAVGSSGKITVIEYGNGNVDVIDPANDHALTTLAVASFNPQGMMLDENGGVIATNATLVQRLVPAYSAALDFEALKPASDYQVQVFLKNEAGQIATKRLAASAAQTAVRLNAGPNTLNVELALNGDQATYEVSSSAVNDTTDNAVTLGDTVTLASGVADQQPGVAYLLIKLSGEAYGSPARPVLIKKVMRAAGLATFTWNTGADNSADGAAYTADQLVGGANFDTLDGQIDVEAYNENGLLVGKNAFPIHVYGKPNVNILVN